MSDGSNAGRRQPGAGRRRSGAGGEASQAARPRADQGEPRPARPRPAAPNWKTQDAGAIPAPILDEIRAAGGAVTFARFMELALTHPAAGYYTGARPGARSPLGSAGDFITVPQRSSFFNRALGRLLAELARAAAAQPAAGGRARIIEVGPGEGDMAAGILGYFEEAAPDLRDICRFQLLEPGPRLRRLQRQALAGAVKRGWQVEWVEAKAPAPETVPTPAPAGAVPAQAAAAGAGFVALPAGPPGVVVTNELLDALPVHLVDVRGPEPLEAWVELSSAGEDRGAKVGASTGGGASGGEATELAVCWRKLSDEAEAELAKLAGCDSLPRGRLRELSRDGFLELRPAAGRFLRSAGAALGSGFVVTIDYGAWRSATGGDAVPVPNSSVRPQLHELTVRGYFRHERQEDPLCRVGEQDLTADVDFAALDRAGREMGLETMLFLPLSDFLEAAGGRREVEELASSGPDRLAADASASLLQALLDPAGVGGLFKVMVQVRE